MFDQTVTVYFDFYQNQPQQWVPHLYGQADIHVKNLKGRGLFELISTWRACRNKQTLGQYCSCSQYFFRFWTVSLYYAPYSQILVFPLKEISTLAVA